MLSKAEIEKLGPWSSIIGPDQNIDRRQCKRQVPMEVLSLGVPRTGTLSMSEAYGILGIPSYHYANVFANCKDADMWIDALEAKFKEGSQKKTFGRPEFDQLLGHVGAVTDAPCVVFWEDLLAAYPEAKVVLVERDEVRWKTSIEGLVAGVLNPVGRYILRRTDPMRTGRILNLGMAWIRYWFGIKGSLTVKAVMDRASDTYQNHYFEIRQKVDPERLLEYKLGSGWEPLCKFLDKDVPNVPFPHLNDAQALDLAFGTFLGTAFAASCLNIGAVLAGILTLYAVYTRI